MTVQSLRQWLLPAQWNSVLRIIHAVLLTVSLTLPEPVKDVKNAWPQPSKRSHTSPRPLDFLGRLHGMLGEKVSGEALT